MSVTACRYGFSGFTLVLKLLDFNRALCIFHTKVSGIGERMKNIFLFGVVVVLLGAVSGCEIIEGFMIALNLDPIQKCYMVQPDSLGRWSGITNPPVNIRDLIDPQYRNDIKTFRLYDIVVRVRGEYPNGQVSGFLFYRFDSTVVEQQLFRFSGKYSQYAPGVSLFNGDSLIITNQSLLNTFIAELSKPDSLPQTVTLRASGTTVTPVVDTVCVCVDIFLQADAEVK